MDIDTGMNYDIKLSADIRKRTTLKRQKQEASKFQDAKLTTTASNYSSSKTKDNPIRNLGTANTESNVSHNNVLLTRKHQGGLAFHRIGMDEILLKTETQLHRKIKGSG